MSEASGQPITPCTSVLIATQGRQEQLRTISLPSVSRQQAAPSLVVLVADGCTFTPLESSQLAQVIHPVELQLLQNRRTLGAAGAWNTGLQHLLMRGFDGFVAMLDDDDEWESDHLSLCLATATKTQASVVVSGLRFMRDGTARARDLPRDYHDRMFLSGNPGWQGSNTFAALQTLATVGGFRDGMASCNDRDLAIRLLRLPDVRLAYTHRWTATWHMASTRQSLSSPRSTTKLNGLRWFWHIYGPEMHPAEEEAFFSRAAELFAIERPAIASGAHNLPPHREPHGDLAA